MKKNKIVLAAMAVVVLAASSCTRGYGCPNNPSHSISDSLMELISFIPFL